MEGVGVKGHSGTACRAAGPLADSLWTLQGRVWAPEENSGTQATTAEVNGSESNHVATETRRLTTLSISEVRGP